MKLSVSIPDDLWAAVFTEGASPSHLAQEAFRLLASKQERAATTSFPNAPAEVDLNEAEETRQALAEELKRLRRAGYEFGLKAVAHLPWSLLDQFSDAETIFAWILMHTTEAEPGEEPYRFGCQTCDLEEDFWEFANAAFQDFLAGPADSTKSETFHTGMALALLDMRQAVMMDLSSGEGRG